MKKLLKYSLWENCKSDYKELIREGTIDDRADVLDWNIIDIIRSAEPLKLYKIRELKTQGANLDEQDKYGNTPLMCACQFGYENIATYLVKSGANINIKDNKGQTALFKIQNTGFIKTLLDAGANINDLDDMNRTALFYTYYYDIVIILISAGINMLVKDRNNMDFIDYMCATGRNINKGGKIIKNVVMLSELDVQTLILRKEPSMISSFIKNKIPIHPNIPDELKHLVTGSDLNLI